MASHQTLAPYLAGQAMRAASAALILFGPSVAQAAPDLVVRNVTVTDVRGERFVPGQDITIKGGLITSVSPTTAHPKAAKRVIDGEGSIALPGFVDTHTHLWQHVSRSMVPASQLQDWASAVYRVAHYASPEDIRNLTDAAAGQALLNGITTVADFASINFSEGATAATITALQANQIDGGVVWWRQAVFLPTALQDRQIAQLKAQAGPKLQLLMGFGPLSFMSVSSVYDGVLSGQRNKLRMTEHSMENLQEARDFQASVAKYLKSVDASGAALAPADRGLLQAIADRPPPSASDAYISLTRAAAHLRGDPNAAARLSPSELQALGALPEFDPLSPLPLLESWNALEDFLSIHSVWPGPSDIAILSRHRATISHNPESNMYLASGAAPIREYVDAKIPVSLGTDGAASNDRINMFDAMRAASALQKVSALDAAATAPLNGWFWLRAATLNGAEALGIADRTGSLEVGKEADILLVDTRRLSASPFIAAKNGVDLLVNSVEARDLAYVIANGFVMVDAGHLKNEGPRAARLQEIAERLLHDVDSGLAWRETFDVTSGMGTDGWWRYRSVRAKDEVDLSVRNAGAKPARVVIAFSGTTFGGQSAPTLRPEVLQRYPLAPPPKYQSRVFLLPPKGILRISRPGGGADYVLTTDGHNETRSSMATEQVLIYVADGVEMP